MVKSLQNTKYSINEKLESSSINLFRQNSIDHAVEEDGELETLDSGEDNGVDSDGSESSDQDETDRETGRSKQISTVPIQLSICSPNVVNLTLIDLPGLTKVAVEGQPDSIVHDIENMVHSYIEKPNCIILAISPANQDIATSDAIKISREVDPTGERTIGVLTKIDLMDKGTDVVDMLEGRAYRLKFPRVLLLSTKKDTPVSDVSDSSVKKLGVDALPAIVGWLPNGEKLILKTGVSVKDIKSGVQDLSNILDSF
ncbi:hypothetical protein RYX36_021640 [Vicia faba]